MQILVVGKIVLNYSTLLQKMLYRGNKMNKETQETWIRVEPNLKVSSIKSGWYVCQDKTQGVAQPPTFFVVSYAKSKMVLGGSSHLVIKWVITPIISGLTLLIPFITGVITHLLSGISHQADSHNSVPMEVDNVRRFPERSSIWNTGRKPGVGRYNVRPPSDVCWFISPSNYSNKM